MYAVLISEDQKNVSLSPFFQVKSVKLTGLSHTAKN